MMDELSFRSTEPKPVQFSFDERRRFFYYARWQAYQAMMMGAQLKRLGNYPVSRFQDEAMRWLDIARDVFPLTQDGETCSIEDILNGKEPLERDPRPPKCEHCPCKRVYGKEKCCYCDLGGTRCASML